MVAPSLTKLVKKVGLNAPPTPPTTSRDDASKKRKSNDPAPEDQRQKKKTFKGDRAIPISSEDTLVARLEQLKIGDSLIGQSLKALDAINSVMIDADKWLCRSLDTPLLAEFNLHRSIQVRLLLLLFLSVTSALDYTKYWTDISAHVLQGLLTMH